MSLGATYYSAALYASVCDPSTSLSRVIRLCCPEAEVLTDHFHEARAGGLALTEECVNVRDGVALQVAPDQLAEVFTRGL